MMWTVDIHRSALLEKGNREATHQTQIFVIEKTVSTNH